MLANEHAAKPAKQRSGLRGSVRIERRRLRDRVEDLATGPVAGAARGAAAVEELGACRAGERTARTAEVEAARGAGR
jgi:hypothetical protein